MLRAIEQTQAAQVVVIQLCLSVTAPYVFCKGAQARAVEAWQEDSALGVFQKLAVFFDHRRAFAGADTKYQQRRRVAVQFLADASALLFAER